MRSIDPTVIDFGEIFLELPRDESRPIAVGEGIRARILRLGIDEYLEQDESPR